MELRFARHANRGVARRLLQLKPESIRKLVLALGVMYTCQYVLPNIQLGRIPKGYAGTRKTVEQITRLIKNGAKDFCVRQTAIDILVENRVPPKKYLREIGTLFEWVKRNIRYTRDIYRVELLHSPRRMLELRAGDCDDMTILLGAMLKAIGHPVRLALVGFNPRRKKLFTHIYLEAFCKGWWIPLDPTVHRPMGWAPPADHKEIFAID